MHGACPMAEPVRWPTSTMLLRYSFWYAHCCSAELFSLLGWTLFLSGEIFLLCWYCSSLSSVFSALPRVFYSAERYSSLPSSFLLCLAFFFSVEHISSLSSICLLCLSLFFSVELFSSMPSVFLCCRAVLPLCRAFSFPVEQKNYSTEKKKLP